jgi:phage gp45-like
MHRATPASTSLRTYTSSGSRATIDTINDGALMQETSCQMMNNQAKPRVESPQNYGFTSVNMPADKDGSGKIIASAECHMSHVGGIQGHSVAGATDDRRHRVRGLASGDVAMNRSNNDDMQIHLAGDGIYHSAPQMVRMQLVPAGSGKANPPQSKAQASQAKRIAYAKHGPEIEARLWAGLEPILQEKLDKEVAATDSGGGGSSGGAQQSPGQSLKTGQKAVASAGQDSNDFMHVKQSDGTWSSSKKIRLSKSKEDDDVLHETNSGDGFDYCGGTPAKHKFSMVLTLAGPSKNVKGRIG